MSEEEEDQHESYIQIVKEHLTALSELGITGEDYMFEIELIYGDVFSKHFTEMVAYLNNQKLSCSSEKLIITYKKIFEKWEEILQSHMEHLAGYMASIFRVPKNVLLPANEVIHEAIKKYSIEEDNQIDKQIDAAQKNIEKKRAYINMLTKQQQKLEIVKKNLVE